MVGALIKYLIIDLCICCFFDHIECTLTSSPVKTNNDHWSIDVYDRFTSITIYRDNKKIKYTNCKIIDNHYESGCWFILIKYDSPSGSMNSTWISYPDILDMYR